MIGVVLGLIMQTLSVSSPAFPNRGNIPESYSCEGQSLSPPLTWSELPAGAQSVSVVVDDPDAPKGTFVHWVVFNLPPTVGSLPEGATHQAMPGGAIEGRNSAGEIGYYPMCPPSGRHRYFFKVYALDTKLGDLPQATAADLEHAMQGHVLAHGELIGTYEKH